MTVPLHPRKKVEIIVEAARAEAVLALVERLGATGYTVIPEVLGKGRHGARGGGDIINALAMRMIIVVAREDVAMAIVEEAQTLLARYTAIVTVSDVAVVRPDHF